MRDMAGNSSSNLLLKIFIVMLLSCEVITDKEQKEQEEDTDDTDASCTSEQVQRCKNAAQSDALSKLGAGGQCEKQQYVHYTHTCTLNVFLPDVDYCCCAYERKVLCCRYHQSHDRYRCSLPEDTIATLSAQGTGGSSNGDHISDRSQGLPLKYLLPAILVPILLIGCCLVCCVKCCLHNEDCDEIRSCWRNKDKKKTLEIEETSSSPTGFHQSTSYQFASSHGHLALGQCEREPLNNPTTNNHFHQMFMPPDPPKRPLEEIMEGDRLMPSAPAPDDIQIPEHIAYMRSISAIEHGHDIAMPLEPCNGDFTHIHCGPHNHVRPAQPQHPQPTSHIPFMRHPHSYPGSINRQDSAISSVSAPARTTHGVGGGGCGGGGHVGHGTSHVGHGGSHVGHRGSDAGTGGNSGDGGTGSNEGTTGNRNTQCPNCSAKPPTYSESFHHPVMEHQLSHSSNHGESPPYSPPSSPDS